MALSDVCSLMGRIDARVGCLRMADDGVNQGTEIMLHVTRHAPEDLKNPNAEFVRIEREENISIRH